nr:hypothetical protein [Tanacetum cinerariifolium]
MRNIKMTMSRMQLNSKFLNNMLPEWGRFVTIVKLNRGLRYSNYDQLYAYIKQHEAHANENKMMLDRFSQHTVDPLALMSNVSHPQHYSSSSSTPPSTYVPPHLADNAHLDSGLSPTDNLIENLINTLALLTQSYKTFLPQTNNQLRTLSNTRNQATVQEIKEMKDVFNELEAEYYKEIYDSIKITRAKHIEQVTALTTKNVNLKAQLLNTMNSVSKDHVKPRVFAPGKYAIDVEPIVPRLRNNREAHLDYLKHLKESVETIRHIVEAAKVVRPLDSLIVYACRYTEHSQELLEYAIGTCPQDSHQRDKKLAPASLIRKKQVTFTEQCDKSNSNTHKHVAKLNTQKTNVLVPPSTGVNRCIDASGSQPRSNTKKNRILPAKGVNKMHVEEQPRTNKSHLRTSNRVDFSSRPKRTIINSNLDSVCQTCNKCLISANHDMCVVDYLQSVMVPLSIRNNCNVVRKVKQVRQV